MTDIHTVLREELDECAGLVRKSFSTVMKEFGYTERDCPKNPAFITRKKLEVRFDGGEKLFGVYKEGKLVGFFRLEKRSEEDVHLNNLSVLPEHRHEGYGSEMLAFAKGYAKGWGGKRLTLGIMRQNERLRNWYISHGFIETGSTKFEMTPYVIGWMETTV